MDWSVLNIPIPIATFFLGFLISRFTLSKVDQKKLEQDYYKNSQDLREKHEALHHAYVTAIKEYTTCDGDPTYDQFFEIAVKGDRYFGHMNVVADAILSGKVDRKVQESTFIPGICNAAAKSLPRHYETLTGIAQKKEFSYSGKLERANFGSLFAVVEKYGASNPALPPAD